MKTILQSLRLYLLLTLLTGIIYPLALTGLAQLFFPKQANGSRLVAENGQLVGSTLLAQNFVSPKYFWPRPSAADYATVASGASNQGPTSAGLTASVQERRLRFGAGAPDDLLTASGSGLDPHLSPAAVSFQIPRVATARGWPNERVAALVLQATEEPQLGFLGEPRVNILLLNRLLEPTN